jgi:DNA-directed RNA polymerase specialized sigma24 family protein
MTRRERFCPGSPPSAATAGSTACARFTGTNMMVADPQDETVTAKVSLERLLGMIPPKQAEVIGLVKIEGLSINEAAAMTGQSESLVKVNIHRGLKKLSSMVETE